MLLSAYRKICEVYSTLPPLLKRKWLMRISMMSLLMLVFFVSYANNGKGQRIEERNITVHFKDAPLKTVLKKLSALSGFNFAYKNEDINNAKHVTYSSNKASMNEVLDAILQSRHLRFVENADNIIIVKATNATGIPLYAFYADSTVNINGTILNEDNQPLVGASVAAVDAARNIVRRRAITDKNGSFVMALPKGAYIFKISFVGYIDQSIKKTIRFGVNNELTAVLIPKPSELAEVQVSTGMVTRDRETFTGATATFTGEQLKNIGNQNIIQSLRTLDPSFILLENNLAGSNPNVLPNIEVRGKTSIPSNALQDQFASDPNQPLFILDGFETSLQTVMNLDMNRVLSVTILKDAASTAMYGSKASNGVIVIETKRPIPGQMHLSYTSDMNVQIPDLSVYNLMNAEEKLKFEKLAGRYTYYTNIPAGQIYLDSLYNAHLTAVKQGVNTYWLSEPVRTAFTQRHTIYADGGDAAMRYGASFTYKNTQGVMKGSGNNSWEGNFNLIYRKGKFNISNQTSIYGYKQTASPYGSFSTYAGANPYYRKVGSDTAYLEQSRDNSLYSYDVPNPLYNASLNSFDKNKNFAVNNNFVLKYTLNRYMRLEGAFRLNKSATTHTVFVSPKNTQFASRGIFEKGSYTNSQVEHFGYSGYVKLSYGRVFGEKHAVTVDLRSDVSDNKNTLLAFASTGFPLLSNGNPSFSYAYTPNSRPSASTSETRTNRIVLTGNYSYDKRYYTDLTYSYSGSTAFGSNKQYSPFYSAGIGWNLNKERFMKNVPWVNLFRLTANIGITGNQNFSSISSISTYMYEQAINLYGQGVSLDGLGNPDLAWQNTVSTNIGADIALFGNKLTININAYEKKTDPLVVAINLPSSTGLSSYPMNVGNLDTKGIDATIHFSPIYKPSKRIVWQLGFTGAMYKSKYGGFNNALAALNTAQQNSNSLIRYQDNFSPDDMWAVPSLGIDPATGREMFLKKNGEYTFDYNPEDIVRVGTSHPTMEGVLSNNVTYKGFSASISIRYSYGSDIFNTALFNKVENISVQGLKQNQDVRALYERWQQPGDISQFKGISLTNSSPMSSRFIQRNNYLSGESFRVGYQFQKQQWLKKLALSSLSINAYLNDIFMISTVKRERGIDYPFARTVSFSLNAQF